MRKKTILFDLDGTLVNSEEGITKSVRYSLGKYQMEENDQNVLRRFIGPPLEESFQREYGFSLEKAREATLYFRERYQDVGLYESELYPGVADALADLKEAGFRLGVASSKQEKFCERILGHFGVSQYFDLIGGARREENISTKIEVLEDVLARFGVADRGEAVLVGDTRYDAQGAKEAGIACIGVTYGFEQDFAQMERAGAVGMFGSMAEVARYLKEG